MADFAVVSTENLKKSRKLAKFFKRQFPEMKGRGKEFTVSMSNLRQAFSYMIGEPMLRNETQSGLTYAVLEAEGEVEAVEAKDEQGKLLHESYPFALKMKNKDSKVTLHILKDRVFWKDGFETEGIVNEAGDKKGQQKTDSQIYPPTSGVSIQGLKVKGDPMFQVEGRSPVSEDQINQVLQRSKEQGIDKAKIIDYLNRRFPDFTTERLSELYEGNVQPTQDQPSKDRKYTSTLRSQTKHFKTQ